MSQRQRLIEQLLLPNANVSELCKSFNVSRKTAYKWLSRYRLGGFSALSNRSKAPVIQPHKISSEMEERIVRLHEENPYWGPRKLRDYLLYVKHLSDVPSHTTFARVLKRHDCHVITSNKSKPATLRFEREQPNDLWQMDFKGSFMTEDKRCYPLTILDDCSRFSISLVACDSETSSIVKGHLTNIFHEFGLPNHINVDNGNPWGSADLTSYTSLQIWLMKLGIKITHSAPFHPQTNGKDERFHRTLKLEVLHQRSYKKKEIQDVFNAWRHKYNYERPHEALNGRTPSHKYHVSSKRFSENPIPFEYEDGIVKKVHSSNGMFCFRGERFRAGKGFNGEYIAIKETDKSDEFAVFFMDNFIKKVKLGESVQ
ncbi:transposase (ISmav2) [Legionella quateirensis]|uniref:Transposase (ISmav2) n=1 Tax=Legionella quateirensis TaxID=45072 RepID=A0A378KYR1_9GAMM|nr:IS481 family transposase [Legionella quateirensis]STY17000.1 transposase (ISmav2) [Legionella quateirensis]